MNNLISFHPVAEIFPLMSETEFAHLCDDLEANGLREEIWTFQGKIIDGRNRYNACLKTGVKPRFREWNGIGALISFVVSLNLHRRNLSESQRAMVADRLADMRRGERTDLPSIAGKLSQTDAANVLNVSVASVERASKVRRDGVEGLAERVEDGTLSVSAAANIASLPKTKQKRVLARQGKDKIVNLASKLRVEATLKKAKTTHDLCLVCNPVSVKEITEEKFVSFMHLLARRVSGDFRRHVNAVIEEIEQLGIADDVREDYELIFDAIDSGFQTEADIARRSGLSRDILSYELKFLSDSGVLEQVPQGGKTSVARGKVKMLWQRREQQLKIDLADDEDDELIFERISRPRLSLVA